MLTTLIATVALSIDMTPLERAIWKVETNCRTGEIWGDNHTSAGPFQIGKAYFTDSKIKGKWPDAVFDLDTSVRCFRAYMARYAKPHRIPEGMTKAEAMARMHNGGPAALRATGKKKENLDRYWSKVQKALKELTR
jgi:hypothetical protein